MENKPTFGTHLFAALSSEAEKLGRRLQSPEFIAKADEVHEAWHLAKAAKPVVHRKRNELLDALVEVCGSDPATTTRPAFSAAAQALADIKAVCLNVTKEEMQRRADAYRRKHPRWDLTPAALAKWWADSGGGQPTRTAANDIYVEPKGWRPVLKNLYGLQEAAVRDKKWLDLAPSTRADLLQRLRNG